MAQWLANHVSRTCQPVFAVGGEYGAEDRFRERETRPPTPLRTGILCSRRDCQFRPKSARILEMWHVLCPAGMQAASRRWVVGEVGLEPTKASASGFTVRPLCRSGHSPVREPQDNRSSALDKWTRRPKAERRGSLMVRGQTGVNIWPIDLRVMMSPAPSAESAGPSRCTADRADQDQGHGPQTWRLGRCIARH
jgi:hypothetical protein